MMQEITTADKQATSITKVRLQVAVNLNRHIARDSAPVVSGDFMTSHQVDKHNTKIALPNSKLL